MVVSEAPMAPSMGENPLLLHSQVQMVILGEVGPGASAMLKEFGTAKEITSSGRKVKDVLKEKALIG